MRYFDEQHNNKSPEINRQRPVLPEPQIVDQRVPVSHHDVIHRIQLQDKRHRTRQIHRVDVPHDRGKPYADLHDDVDDLRQIPEEYDDRRREINLRGDEHDHSKGIIQHLQHIRRRIESVQRVHHHREPDEEQMHEQCGHNLDHRQDVDGEHNLLDQVAVLQHRVCARTVCLREIKPRNETRDQPEHVRHTDSRFRDLCARAQRLFKDKPVDENRDDRLYKGPENSKIRTREPRPEIIFRQLEYQLFIAPDIPRNLDDPVPLPEKNQQHDVHKDDHDDLFYKIALRMNRIHVCDICGRIRVFHLNTAIP